MRRHRLHHLFALTLGVLLASPALGTKVRDVCRLAEQGDTVLQGLGLVVGLPGTGDTAKDLVVARPLAQVLRNNGVPIASFEELRSTRSVALVMVTCRVPAGASVHDRYDVIVSAVGSASSLDGGELYLSPLTGPFPGQGVYAMASGRVEADDHLVRTRGRVREGAHITRPFPPLVIGGAFELVVDPAFAGFGSTTHIASRIQDEYLLRPTGLDDEVVQIAEPVNDRTIRVYVPDVYRDNPAPFVADVLATEFDTAQLRLPARVVVNRATGAIVVTRDVEISLVAIAHKNLVIRRLTPPPQPTPADPLVETASVVGMGTEDDERGRARLEDLLNAFKQLDVPVEDQIEILHMLHKSGRLHAELIVD